MSIMIEWVKEVFIIVLSLTFLEILLPDGSMAKYLKFIFSIMILAVILGPIANLLN